MKNLPNHLKPVPYTRVSVAGTFWSPRIENNRSRSIPSQYRMLSQFGHVASLDPEWKPGDQPMPFYFEYETIYKWIEAACYSISTHPDKELESLLDGVVNTVAKAQRADGFIPASYDDEIPERRDRVAEGMYSGGHLIEAAVAHFQTTGKRVLLDVARRYADFLCLKFGKGAGQQRGYSLHPGVELALMKLAATIDEKRYSDLAAFFVNERGQSPHYFDQKTLANGGAPTRYWAGTWEYNQSHVPVREQSEVRGHAVMAMYLFSGVSDVARVKDDRSLQRTAVRVWDKLVSRRMYITGGLGSDWNHEGFTSDFDLPNESAYAETCAAIGLVFWAHRMLNCECDGRYADVMERALYNGVLSGVSLDGSKYFYENPLASRGRWARREWYGCNCCLPNLSRLLASLGGYAYSETDSEIIVHLYIGGQAIFSVGERSVELNMETDYPWDERVHIVIGIDRPFPFDLKLRIPGWASEFEIAVNGKHLSQIIPEDGYVRIKREWRNGDRILLRIAMPARITEAHPSVSANRGRVAIERGPIVYCIEQFDNSIPTEMTQTVHELRLQDRIPLDSISLARNVTLAPRFEQDTLGGVVVIEGDAYYTHEWGDQLYAPSAAIRKPMVLRAIPYFAWNNRGQGEMLVWIRRDGG